jgi:hypothetical protein
MTNMSSFATSWTISEKSYSWMNTTRFEKTFEIKGIGKNTIYLSSSLHLLFSHCSFLTLWSSKKVTKGENMHSWRARWGGGFQHCWV